MDVAIKAENISKSYQIGEFSTGTVTNDIKRWWVKSRGGADPFARIDETNINVKSSDSNTVWSLKDVNFQIDKGHAVGVIGRNGAGKSTLLKLLSRVTTPTTGSLKIKGRIASLLEVGTGFHPELTGRENVFLNGAILGMKKTEIKKKFDEIVDFSGVAKYIDTPVKRYSSGMYVRLAFAVAAHLESEILIVDEVLAVGDTEFQQKCIGKMGDVSRGEGKTILFVSHNIPIIQKLCNRGIFLEHGKIKHAGSISDTIDKYLATHSQISNFTAENNPDLEAAILKIEIQSEQSSPTSEIPVGSKWKVVVRFQVNKVINNFISAVGVSNVFDIAINTSWQPPRLLTPGIYEAEFLQAYQNFAIGTYKITVGLSQHKRSIHFLNDAIAFNIIPVVSEIEESVIDYSGSGLLLNPMEMSTVKITG